MPYCRNCGKELAAQAVVCPGCGVLLPKGDNYCQNCGNPVSPIAEVCVKCGLRLTRVTRKSKATSVLLAVFLGFWSWLYTYKRDGRKFWLGLGISLVFTAPSYRWFLWLYFTPATEGSFALALIAFLWVLIGWLGAAGIWVWAIVNTAVRKQEWYELY